MPKSTYVSRVMAQVRGRKQDKSRFTALFCCNLDGTCKMKPLLVHQAAKLQAFHHVKDMDSTGVYWWMALEAWMTSHIVID